MNRLARSLATQAIRRPVAFAPASFRGLATIKYSESHEFCSLDGDIATVGITAHAADALGDIVFIELPSTGSEFEKGDSFGAVESVKAASDVYSPVAGEVIEVNSNLDDTPGLVNDSPIEEGWFMRIKLNETGKSDFEGLMDEAAYTEHVENS